MNSAGALQVRVPLSIICTRAATLEWVSWFNHHRLLEPLGYIPPAEAEANYYKQLSSQAIPA